MENRAHALAAGLFTILLGAALIGIAIWFSKDDAKLARYDIVTTQSVSGLQADAAVRYRGVEVGHVGDIHIEPGASGRIRIELDVKPGTPVTKATYAELGYQGVTGLAFVSLNDDGSSTELVTSKGNDIVQVPLRASLLDRGEDLLGAVSEIAGRVNKLLSDDNQKAVQRTLAGMEKATERTAQLAEELSPGVRGIPGLVTDTHSLVTDTRSAVQDTRVALADARTAVQKADLLLASLNSLSAKIDERIEVLNRVATTVDDVGGTARAVNDETLPRLNALVDELQRESRSLDRLLSVIGENPQSIVFGAPRGAPGPGEAGFSQTGVK